MFQGRFKSVLILDECRVDEGVGREPGISDAAAAQGIRRFWKRAPDHAGMRGFANALVGQMSNG